MNIKLLLLGCLVITMHHKEDSMGKVKTYIAIRNTIDYDYIKFMFSDCGVECNNEEALLLYIMNNEQLCYGKTREC